MTAPQALKYSFQQIMLRIKDPKLTVPFYQKYFGMTLVHEYHFPQWKFSLYFMELLKDGETLPFSVPSAESEKYLWNMEGCTLELTHNWGTEDDENFSVNNGNVEPHRGFGHIAFNVEDVDTFSNELIEAGVSFKKKPWEGRMRNIAFALDPDGYWLELVTRTPGLKYPGKINLSQCMIRVKNPQDALDFYCGVLGMHLVRYIKNSDFDLYFLVNPHREGQTPLSESEGHIPNVSAQLPNYYPLTEENRALALSDDAKTLVQSLWRCTIELTHNYGTETNPDFKYHNGNEEPHRGFGHIGFLVDDLGKACEDFDAQKVAFRKRPETGMQGLAFILDKDTYSTEIIQRGIAFGPENYQRPEKYQF